MAVSAGAGRGASRLRALLMPLSVIECEADIRPGRDIHTMSNVRAIDALHGLRSDPVKGSVAMFLAEVLAGVLREGPADRGVWHFIAGSIRTLDRMDPRRVANFHLCFLYGLGQCLGVAPDATDYAPGRVFDMRDGCFRSSAPLHADFLSPMESRAVWAVSRLTYANMHGWRMSRQQRQAVLDIILDYYAMHYAPMSGLKSLDVLRMLM